MLRTADAWFYRNMEVIVHCPDCHHAMDAHKGAGARVICRHRGCPSCGFHYRVDHVTLNLELVRSPNARSA